MKPAKIGISEVIIFIVIVFLFINYGQSVGWRALGGVQLFLSFYVIFKKRIGVGVQGYEPSFYITGIPAVLIGLFSAAIAIMLIFFPEETVIKWGAK